MPRERNSDLARRPRRSSSRFQASRSQSSRSQSELDDGLRPRLDAYFADLRARPLRETLKRRTANWQVYAAVTGSALAMATGASAAMLGGGMRGILAAEAVAASVFAAGPLASARNNRLGATPLAAAAAGQAPAITAAGVVPLCSNVNTIAPGEWVTIYGTNLANQTATWNNDFPISLGGTSVTINGKPAYLNYVSPGQINLQAPDDSALGSVAVVVTTGAGSVTSYVTLNTYAPSFSLLDAKHVSGIILRTNKRGAYGGGSYDLLGPTGNALGYPTVAAMPGDNIELFAVGLGPTTPVVPAGQVYSGAAPVNNPISLYINGASVQPTFVGVASAGIYQINLTVPSGGLGEGDLPIFLIAGGVQTQPGIVISMQKSVVSGGGGTVGTGGGGTFVGPIYFTSTGFGGGTFGGTGFGGGSGGTGGGAGSYGRHRRKPYTPKLKYPPK